jgi:hypothetical protein
MKLNKNQEAEKALTNGKRSNRSGQNQDSSLIQQIPNGAAGLFMLG